MAKNSTKTIKPRSARRPINYPDSREWDIRVEQERVARLGLKPDTLRHARLDLADLVRSEEFHKHDNEIPVEDRGKYYSRRTVERLLKAKVPFSSEPNTLGDVLKVIELVPTCPYGPHGPMAQNNISSGSSYGFTCTTCGAKVGVTYRYDGFHLTPGDEPGMKEG